MDGGRVKWEKENRPLTARGPGLRADAVQGRRSAPTPPHRAFRDEVLKHMEARRQLVDVRSPEEYTGTRMHMPDYPNEGALRGGHIPGAKSIPWARAINPRTARSRPPPSCRSIYCEENSSSPTAPTIAYCRIGERSSHTWFALKYLLGFENVRTTTALDRVGQPGRSADREVEPTEVPSQLGSRIWGSRSEAGCQMPFDNCSDPRHLRPVPRSVRSDEHAPQLRRPVP